MAKPKNNKDNLAGLEGETLAAEARPVLSPIVNKHKRFEFRLLPRSKKEWFFTVFGGLVAILAVVLAVPYSRYGLIGQFVKRPVVIEVLDSRTGKPVSDVEVSINSQKPRTDAKGEVRVANVPVGSWQVMASKKYYDLQITSVIVPLFGPAKTFKLSLSAIGNQVTVKVTNKVSGKPLSGAAVAALGTKATTDVRGEAVLVLPVDSKGVTGTVKHDGFNDLTITVLNTETQTAGNAFALTPSGKVYFLSKRTGKIDVMKSDLDGGNASVVLAGTGRESDSDTVLLASRDWKYLALKASRDSDKAKLYVVSTADDKLDLMDQGDADFTLLGWLDHYFVYDIARHGVQNWQPNAMSIKSYNADSDHINTLASTEASGSSIYDAQFDTIWEHVLTGDKIVFIRTWHSGSGYTGASGRQDVLQAIKPDGSGNSTLKSVDSMQAYFSNLAVAKPNLLYFGQFSNGSDIKPVYFKLQGGSISQADSIPGIYNGIPAPTYLVSPSNKSTFWAESRDGKNTLFTGDLSAGKAKQIAALSEFTPYGWFSEDFVLVSKEKSELYIAPADFSAAPLKITDYHRASGEYGGGGGYGGQ